MELNGKNITVVGLGRSGLAASRLLAAAGARVSVSEAREDTPLKALAQALKGEGISVELGAHTRPWIQGQDLIVASPGVPPTSPPLRWAREEGVPMMSEIELGSHLCKGKIIAITGSNGKSTTVSLLGKILEKGRKRAFICGNIGTAFCEVVPHVTQEDWVVLEVSSFQLEQCYHFRPHIAGILNISRNHLDRHTSFEEYLLAKRRIAQAQTGNDVLLLNADDPFTRKIGEGLPVQKRYFSRLQRVDGVYMKDLDVFASLNDRDEKVGTFETLRLPGSHNQENALAAVLGALLVGVAKGAIQEGLDAFEGLAHRIEWAGEWGGIRFVNDSKSTTVSSTLRALESLPGPLLLIAGGREKNEDFQVLARSPLLRKVKEIYLIGEAKEKIHAAVKGKVPTFFAITLGEAVKQAYHDSQAGETILLSPMCTSFDMFKDFEERGDCFKERVAGLIQEEKSPQSVERGHAG